MALSMVWASSSVHRMAPPRGPRRVLCVVKVTMSATGTGEGCTPPAMRPAMWAASNMKYAPTSSAMSRNGCGVDDAGVGGGAGHDDLGPVLEGDVAHLVVVDALVGGGDPVGHEVVELARWR